MSSTRLTDGQLDNLSELIRLTRPDELTCEDWLGRVGAYAESVAAGGVAASGSELVEHHLSLCWECREEFEALLAVLRSRIS